MTDSSKRVYKDTIKHGMNPNYGLMPEDIEKQEAEDRARKERIAALPRAEPSFVISPVKIKPKDGKSK